MTKRAIVSILLVLGSVLTVVRYTEAYGVHLSFPAPRRYVVTQGYSAEHEGYDYGFPNDRSVVAAKAGTVSASRWTYADGDRWYPSHGDTTDRGNYIILDQGGGAETRYYHLSYHARQGTTKHENAVVYYSMRLTKRSFFHWC